MRRLAHGIAAAAANVSWTTLVSVTLSLTGGTCLDLDFDLTANVTVGGVLRVLQDGAVIHELSLQTGSDRHIHTLASSVIPRTADPVNYAFALQVQGEGLASSVVCNAATDDRHGAVIRYDEAR